MDEEKPSSFWTAWKWVKGFGWVVIPAFIIFQQTSKIRYDNERLHLLLNVASKLGIGQQDTREGYEQYE